MTYRNIGTDRKVKIDRNTRRFVNRETAWHNFRDKDRQEEIDRDIERQTEA